MIISAYPTKRLERAAVNFVCSSRRRGDGRLGLPGMGGLGAMNDKRRGIELWWAQPRRA